MKTSKRRLKHVSQIRSSNVDKKSVESELPVRLCNYVDVYKNRLITDDLSFMSATATQAQIADFGLRAGDILVTKDSETPDDIGVPAYVPENLDGVVCGYHLSIVRPDTSKLDPAFLAWVLQSEPIRHYFTAKANGVTRFALGYAELGDAPIPIPAMDGQRAIVGFLDKETAKVDALIAAKKRLVETADEWRHGFIVDAVSGKSESEQIKSLGVEWLGNVPSDWKTWKLGHAFHTIGSGTTPMEADGNPYGGDVPWVTTSELRETWITGTAKMVGSETLAQYPALKVFPVGTLLVAMYGATIGRLGLLGIPACTNQACCALYGSTVLDTKFVYYWLLAYRAEIIRLGEGAGQPNISQDTIRNLRVPAPNIATQRRIALDLDQITAQASQMITKIEAAMSVLREYRAALITAAVTGQVDVSGAA